jgi:hypothetical protein
MEPICCSGLDVHKLVKCAVVNIISIVVVP